MTSSSSLPIDTATTANLLLNIAQDVGTPTYVYDLEIIRDKLQMLKRTFTDASTTEVLWRYAVKANPSAAVLAELARHGVGAEAITIGELERALAAGIPAHNIVLGGPAQDARLRARALEANVGLVSLDSLSQAETWLAEPKLPNCVIRVNPALDPHTHEHLATGAATSKFGMTVAEARQLAPKLGESLRGFHVHAGSQIDVPTVYDDIFNALSPLYDAFPKLDLLDIGGGFAVPNAPLAEMAARIREFVKAHHLKLIVEPGRYLVAEAGTLLTEVLHVKEGARKHVICNAGMADLLRPALYGATHPIHLLAEDASTRPQVVADVDGPLCENADRLGQAVSLPEPRAGDVLAVSIAGAYGMAMASNYASHLRPAEVVIDGSKYQVVRQREQVDDLLRLEIQQLEPQQLEPQQDVRLARV